MWQAWFLDLSGTFRGASLLGFDPFHPDRYSEEFPMNTGQTFVPR
jgi:hypothetical protein